MPNALQYDANVVWAASAFPSLAAPALTASYVAIFNIFSTCHRWDIWIVEKAAIRSSGSVTATSTHSTPRRLRGLIGLGKFRNFGFMFPIISSRLPWKLSLRLEDGRKKINEKECFLHILIVAHFPLPLFGETGPRIDFRIRCFFEFLAANGSPRGKSIEGPMPAKNYPIEANERLAAT